MPVPVPPGLVDELVALCEREPQNAYHAHSLAVYNPAAALPLLEACHEAVQQVAGVELVASHTYFRVYQRGSYLKEHTDREGLDWTVSLMLRCDAPPWPLEVQAEDGTWCPVDGDAVLVHSAKVNHRRSVRYAGDEACVLMLHYREV